MPVHMISYQTPHVLGFVNNVVYQTSARRLLTPPPPSNLRTRFLHYLAHLLSCQQAQLVSSLQVHNKTQVNRKEPHLPLRSPALLKITCKVQGH